MELSKIRYNKPLWFIIVKGLERTRLSRVDTSSNKMNKSSILFFLKDFMILTIDSIFDNWCKDLMMLMILLSIIDF